MLLVRLTSCPYPFTSHLISSSLVLVLSFLLMGALVGKEQSAFGVVLTRFYQFQRRRLCHEFLEPPDFLFEGYWCRFVCRCLLCLFGSHNRDVPKLLLRFSSGLCGGSGLASFAPLWETSGQFWILEKYRKADSRIFTCPKTQFVCFS